MANPKFTTRVTVAAVVLSFVAGVYSVGHLGGWLKFGLEATSTDADAQGSDAMRWR